MTGAAGFIGFHTALRLAQRGDLVVGLDNFNPYYNVQLKRDRVKQLQLQAPQVSVVEGDITDEPALRRLFDTYRFTHVLHLAAQAGVRYSLKHPLEYVRSNCDGFVKVLECCRQQQQTQQPTLVYASSSSVYGLNQQVPFREEDTVSQPASLYAVTKRMNELAAHAYHHLYGLSVTGLRYFTVYGPWGRPDMACYAFAEAMRAQQPIELYQAGDVEPCRDFTFIDDAVSGTVAALDYGAACEVFNIGNHRMEPLRALVHALERELGVTARKVLVGRQPGDVPRTYANLDKSQRLLGYQPTVSLDEGIRRFVAWYRAYHGSSTTSTERLVQSE